MSNYRHYFALEKQIKTAGYPINRFDLISQFTKGKKKGLSELSHVEYADFIAYIRTNYSGMLSGDKEKKSKSIKTAVHYLCLSGMVTAQDRPDYNRINEFVKNIGSNNPRKVTLNLLTPGELNKVVTQIKTMYQKEIKK